MPHAGHSDILYTRDKSWEPNGGHRLAGMCTLLVSHKYMVPLVKHAERKRRALVSTLVSLLGIEGLILRRLTRAVDRALVMVSMLAQAATLVGMFSGAGGDLSTQASRVSHTVFGVVMLLIPILGISPLVLGLHACMAMFVVASRRILDGCMFSAVDDDQILLDPGINWDWTFAVAGCISIVRLTGMAG